MTKTKMKAITCWPEWAALITLGFKAAETRTAPPAGEMCPAGVKAESGFKLERGEMIGVVAGKHMRRRGRHELGGTWSVENDGGGLLLRGDKMAWPYRLPMGGVTAVSAVAGAWPVEQVRFEPDLDHDEGAPPWLITSKGLVLRASERPIGDYSEGRWVWALHPPTPLEPIPMRGNLGVIGVPVEVSDIIEARMCRVTTITIWEHSRTGLDMSALKERLPEWAGPWFMDVTNDLWSSFRRMRREIQEAFDELAGAEPGPGPYQDHLRYLAAEEYDKLEQRLWAQLKPAREVPARIVG